MKPITTLRSIELAKQKEQQNNKKSKEQMSPVLRSYLYDKSREDADYKPNSSLIIMQNNINTSAAQKETKPSFDAKKALAPLLIGTLALFGITAGVSRVIKSAASTILKSKAYEQLPDLALNMNIKQEPHFATYMMLRNPNIKTLLGAVGVFTMSALTLISKNFVDGIKEIWIKKQESDIERDLKEKLIETETKVFAGKLEVERGILSRTAGYFKKVFNEEDKNKSSIYKFSSPFRSFASFGAKEPSSDKQKNTKMKNNLIFGGIIALTALSAVIAGRITFKNIRKTAEEANKFTNEFAQKTIDYIDDVAKKGDSGDLKVLENLFQVISATPEYIKDTLGKLNAPEKEVQRIINSVAEARRTIFSDAPIALGGVPKKIQYYCYIDENRGHLYNWIMHPENKFVKYVFLSFTGVSAAGYMGQEAIDAVKRVAVAKENSNTELNLQKRLIDVELKNYESKKNCAVNPLMEEFNRSLTQGVNKEELKNLADNILLEIKNGPPFVYS